MMAVDALNRYATINYRADLGATWLGIENVKSDANASRAVIDGLAVATQDLKVDFIVAFRECARFAKSLAKSKKVPVITVDGMQDSDALIANGSEAEAKILGVQREKNRLTHALIYEDFVLRGVGAVCAAAELSKLGVCVLGVVCVVEIPHLGGAKILGDANIPLHALTQFSSDGRFVKPPSDREMVRPVRFPKLGADGGDRASL